MFDDRATHSFLEQLNPEQRAAATYSGETLLILAGAGTGKTTTLCSRAAWLMAEGVPAERMLLLTFTRRAAGEMVERARTLAERVAPDAGRIVGGTFHSVAHRTIRVHAGSLGLDAGFGVLDVVSAPLTSQWSLRREGPDQLSLVGPNGPWETFDDVKHVAPPEWTEALEEEQRCLVIFGSQLGLERFDVERVNEAIQASQAAVATVRWRCV